MKLVNTIGSCFNLIMAYHNHLSRFFAYPGCLNFRILFLLLALISPSLQAEASGGGDTGVCVVPNVNLWSPPKTALGPVRIEVEFFLIDLIEINSKSNSFTIDFAMALSWQDARLAGAANQGAGCIASLDSIWHPDFIFLNAGESDLDHTGNVEILENGEVLYSRRYTRTFAIDLELRKFPFDNQTLIVQIVSMLYGPDQLEFYGEPALTSINEGASLPGWTVEALQIELQARPIITATSSHSSVEYKISVERQSAYYLWRTVFPLLLLMLMAWSVFWLEPEHLSAQISVAIGAIFSLMSFLVSQGSILPPVSYMTIADILIFISLLMIFIAFGESVVTGQLAREGRNRLAQRIDRIGRWVYILVIFMLGGWITVLMFT